METLWIIRHGERKDNANQEHKNLKHLRSAPHNTPITDLGKEQGFLLGNRIVCQERRLPKYIYSSPYLRSIETSIEIANGMEETFKKMRSDKEDNRKIKIRVEYGLAEPIFESTERKEIYYDKLLSKEEHYINETMETSMLAKKFPDRIDYKYKSFFRLNDIPKRETLKTYGEKILNLKRFINTRKDKLGILVCHGGLTTDLCINIDPDIKKMVKSNPSLRKDFFHDMGSSNYGACGLLVLCPIKKQWILTGGVNNDFLKMRNLHKSI